MFLFSWQHHYGWEPFNFTKSSLPFLCSWSFLCALPKKSLLYPESGKSFLVIFSEFCSFPLRSMVHFELNFVKGVNSVTSFIVLCMEIQLSQRHWLKKIAFLHCCPLLFHQRSWDYLETSVLVHWLPTVLVLWPCIESWYKFSHSSNFVLLLQCCVDFFVFWLTIESVVDCNRISFWDLTGAALIQEAW